MASNQTQNYGLSQWELTDNVRMEDFNSDNAKIDAALANRYGPGNPGWVMGSYVGNGDTEPHEIDIGFRPAALIIIGATSGCGFLLDNGEESHSASTYYLSGHYVWASGFIQAVDNGFTVMRPASSTATTVNGSEQIYWYLALRR